MFGAFGKLLRDKRGGVAIEYGLIIALVVIALIGALRGLAAQTITMWTNVADEVVAAPNR